MRTPNAEKVAKWLRSSLTVVADHIEGLYLFGSITRGESNPGDCDVLILTPSDPESDERRALRAKVAEAKNEFLKRFGIPLSVILLGVQEYHSLRWFKLKGRKKTFVRIELSLPAQKNQ